MQGVVQIELPTCTSARVINPRHQQRLREGQLTSPEPKLWACRRALASTVGGGGTVVVEIGI